MDDDQTLLEEELCAIEAIFGDDCKVEPEQRMATVWVPSRGDPHSCQLALLYPSEGYPSRRPPDVELAAPHLPPDALISLRQELEDLFLPGAVCTFDMVDLLKERLQPEEAEGTSLHEVGAGDAAADGLRGSAKDDEGARAAAAATPLADELAARIVTGDPFTDRKSTFQARADPLHHKSPGYDTSQCVHAFDACAKATRLCALAVPRASQLHLAVRSAATNVTSPVTHTLAQKQRLL